MTQYIEFDEVISKSATETEYGSQPLGDIAAIGRGGKPINNGHIVTGKHYGIDGHHTNGGLLTRKRL